MPFKSKINRNKIGSPHEPMCVVIDMGRTHTKISVIDTMGMVHEKKTFLRPTHQAKLYNIIDIDSILDWFLKELAKFSTKYHIDRIIPIAHGATCAFIGFKDDLLLPIQDYDSEIPFEIKNEYRKIRPQYQETYSPSLPKGLNLGLQIFWQFSLDETLFSRTKAILNLPQYFTWLLTGRYASEVTSFGCHTDLWSPNENDFSSMVYAQGWDLKFPKFKKAWEKIGYLKPSLKQTYNIENEINVCTGLHDSNAALSAVILSPPNNIGSSRASVLSTGTWFIAMAQERQYDQLKSINDTLVNYDIFARPVPSSRFMGGRAFSLITNGHPDIQIKIDHILEVIRDKTLAIPSFVDMGGPISHTKSEIRNLKCEDLQLRAAVGTLYLAAMSITCLDNIRSKNPLIIEGKAASNNLLCQMIASLYDGPTYVIEGIDAVALGGAMIGFYGDFPPASLPCKLIEPIFREQIRNYKNSWYEAIYSELVA